MFILLEINYNFKSVLLEEAIKKKIPSKHVFFLSTVVKAERTSEQHIASFSATDEHCGAALCTLCAMAGPVPWMTRISPELLSHPSLLPSSFVPRSLSSAEVGLRRR